MIALGIAAPAAPATATPASAGQLFAFGNNPGGQLGSTTNNGTNEANPTPTLVTLPGASGPTVRVATGEHHSLALTSTGQLYAFGDNNYGQLGSTTNFETFNPNPAPTQVSLPGASGHAVQIAAGEHHSLVVTSTGQLYAFGMNGSGQLGALTNGSTFNPNPTPTQVTLPGASGPAVQVAAGERHSLALTSTGQLYAFGNNSAGQLGNTTNNGTNFGNSTPTLVAFPGASGPVTGISAGAGYSLALTSTGQLFAFGSNYTGQLGNTTNIESHNPNPTPTQVSLPGATGPISGIAAGAAHSLALTSTGQLYAFGYNHFGQLGSTTNNGTDEANPTPTVVTLPGASGPVIRVATGEHHSLALTSTGQLYAFGYNYHGQLGSTTNNGTDEANPIPTAVDLGAGTTVATMSSGSFGWHSLAVISNLTITSASLPAGRVGAPYGASATAAGGSAPYSWQASGLPAGLTIEPANGLISGTPQVGGTTHVSLRVSDSFGIVASSAPIALNVEDATTWNERPAISGLRQAHRRWRGGNRLAKISSSAMRRRGRATPLGTTFAFNLSRAAWVRLTFARRSAARFKRAGVLAFAGRAGRNRVRFHGRISSRKRLMPGRYRMTAVAKRDGMRSRPRSLSFTIVGGCSRARSAGTRSDRRAERRCRAQGRQRR